MAKGRMRAVRVGGGELVSPEDLPEAIRGWPAWMIAIWVALAEGRRWSEAAGAATLAAEHAGEVPPSGLPVQAGHVWRVVRDWRYTEHFKPLLDEQWKPMAEPAMALLGKLVAEGSAETATETAKERALAAAKEVLKFASPPKSDGGRVQVNVSGEGAHVAVVGLDELLRSRAPFRPRSLAAGPAAEVEAEAVPAVEATQPRRSRTSSQRTAGQRGRVREQAGRG